MPLVRLIPATLQDLRVYLVYDQVVVPRPPLAHLHDVDVLELQSRFLVFLPAFPQEDIHVLPHLLPCPVRLPLLPYVVQYQVVVPVSEVGVYQDTQLSFGLPRVYLLLLLRRRPYLVPPLYPLLLVPAREIPLYLYRLPRFCDPLNVWHVPPPLFSASLVSLS